MTARHLVDDLELALDRDEDLDHLNHARRQLVAAFELFNFVLEGVLDQIDLTGRAIDDATELVFRGFVIDADLTPVRHRQLIKIFLGQLLPLVEQNLPAVVTDPSREPAADEQSFQAPESAVLENADFVMLIFPKPHDLFILDRLAALVFAQALARENPHIDDRALDPGRNPKRGIADLTGFFAEDCAQQFFFGRKLGLAFGRDLADQNIARLHFRANPDNPSLVEVPQAFITDIG